MTAFVDAMLRDLPGRFVVARDGGPTREVEPILALEGRFADRLSVKSLPTWAPMPDPEEPLWSWLEWERLSNFAARDVREPDERVVAEQAAERSDQRFLKNLVHSSELPPRGHDFPGPQQTRRPAANRITPCR